MNLKRVFKRHKNIQQTYIKFYNKNSQGVYIIIKSSFFKLTNLDTFESSFDATKPIGDRLRSGDRGPTAELVMVHCEVAQFSDCY